MGIIAFVRARLGQYRRPIDLKTRRVGDTKTELEGFVIGDQWGRGEDVVLVDSNTADRDPEKEKTLGVSPNSITRFTGSGRHE